MPRPFHACRCHAVVSLAVVAVFLTAPALAEIVKCVAKDGSPLYQNFPCHIDSLGSMPSTVKAAGPAQPLRGEAIKVLPASARANGSLVGMTADEVVKLMGEPEERIEDEPPGGRISIWRYADGRLVRFNNRHRVLAVQR